MEISVIQSISSLDHIISYDDGESRQQESWQRVQAGGNAEVLGFQFHTVITLGNRAQKALDVDLSQMQSLGLSDTHLRTSSRGGEATLHSPGQLVIYPIFPIRRWELGVRPFVELFLSAVQTVLQKRYGISAEQVQGKPGLFTSRGKIASIGIRVDRGVTLHGLALNVSNDLNLFKSIRVCGVQGQKMDEVSSWVSPFKNTDAELQRLFEAISQELEANIPKHQGLS